MQQKEGLEKQKQQLEKLVNKREAMLLTVLPLDLRFCFFSRGLTLLDSGRSFFGFFDDTAFFRKTGNVNAEGRGGGGEYEGCWVRLVQAAAPPLPAYDE